MQIVVIETFIYLCYFIQLGHEPTNQLFTLNTSYLVWKTPEKIPRTERIKRKKMTLQKYYHFYALVLRIVVNGNKSLISDNKDEIGLYEEY